MQAESDRDSGANGHRTQDDPLLGRLLDGRFQIKAPVAAGGMGAVYRAEQRSMSRDVAIKVLRTDRDADEHLTSRFLTEARAASRLRNPHTITVFDFGRSEDGILYLVMELLIGRTLGDELRAGESVMALGRAAGIVGQVLDSLEEAHDVGVLHRDLKPDNIFMLETSGARDFIKVLDFGVAKIVGESGMSASGPGLVFGTPVYMSPEQMMGGEVDPRSDLYSLGVILFELLAGQPPFVGDSALALARQKARSTAPALHDVNPSVRSTAALDWLIARLLAANPSDRPEDAAECRSMLRAAVEADAPASAIPGKTPTPVSSMQAPAEATVTMFPPTTPHAGREAPGAAAAHPPSPVATSMPWPTGTGSKKAVSADVVRTPASRIGRKPSLTPGADRRANPRRQMLAKLTCVAAGTPRTAFLANASLTGGYVHSDWLPNPRERLALVFPGNGTAASGPTLVAEVVRVIQTPTQPGVVRGFSVRWVTLQTAGRLEALATFFQSVFGEPLHVPFSLDTESSYWEYSFATHMLVDNGM
jgi:serine/threonine-protein kinase